MVVYFVMIGYLPSDCLVKLKCDRIIRFFCIKENQDSNSKSMKQSQQVVNSKWKLNIHSPLNISISSISFLGWPLESFAKLTSTLSALRRFYSHRHLWGARRAPTSRTTSIWLRREILSVTLYKELSVVFEDQKRKLWFYTQTQATLSKLRIVCQLLTIQRLLGTRFVSIENGFQIMLLKNINI